ncbi:hypothetical protein [Pseudomonas sp. SbOxS1]|nr:hypothetical protein [Pseudomonas sp. SbOxS1]
MSFIFAFAFAFVGDRLAGEGALADAFAGKPGSYMYPFHPPLLSL